MVCIPIYAYKAFQFFFLSCFTYAHLLALRYGRIICQSMAIVLLNPVKGGIYSDVLTHDFLVKV